MFVIFFSFPSFFTIEGKELPFFGISFVFYLSEVKYLFGEIYWLTLDILPS